MVLLSLDQSSHITGYALFQDKKLLTYGIFNFDDSNIGKRLIKICDKIKSLINEYAVDEVVFEDIQMQTNIPNNVQTFKTLAMVYGTIEALLTSINIPHSTILAATWKNKLGIKGRTRDVQKKNAWNYVTKKYNLKNVIQDSADAICIGEAHLQEEVCAW